MTKKVFITYSWDTPEHKEWVRSLAQMLIDNGIEVMLDQYDILPGESFTHFMESSIDKADKVLVVLTPNYKNKSLGRKGGVGYEQQIISGEIMSGIERKKFIPIIRLGAYEEGKDCAIPPHFKGISTIDFRQEASVKESTDELLRAIYEQPKFIKPALGVKPKFDIPGIAPLKSFVIKLSRNFNFVQSEASITDILMQISDLRKEGTSYKLEYEVEGISNQYKLYQQLTEIVNPSDEEISDKLRLRHYLNQCFFLRNGTLIDYLNCSLCSIIDFSFNKYGYIANYFDLYRAVKECFRLFSGYSFSPDSNTNPFDIIHYRNEWIFRIDVSDEEVGALLAKFGVKEKLILTVHAGLCVFDLSNPTVAEQVIPRQSYQFTIDFFQQRIADIARDEYFKLGNWKIGLA